MFTRFIRAALPAVLAVLVVAGQTPASLAAGQESDSPEAMRQALVVTLVPQAMVRATRQQIPESASIWAWRSATLTMMVATTERGERYSVIPFVEAVQEKLHLEADAVWALAMSNTARLAGQVTLSNAGNGALEVKWEGYPGAGVLLADEFWARPQLKALGPDVAVLVMEHSAIVAPASAPAVEIMRVLVICNAGDREMMNPAILYRRGGVWTEEPVVDDLSLRCPAREEAPS